MVVSSWARELRLLRSWYPRAIKSALVAKALTSPSVVVEDGGHTRRALSTIALMSSLSLDVSQYPAVATSDTYLPASERRSAFIFVMAEDWSSIALIDCLSSSLVVAEALRLATSAFRAFTALVLAFKASAIGFGSETGLGSSFSTRPT